MLYRGSADTLRRRAIWATVGIVVAAGVIPYSLMTLASRPEFAGFFHPVIAKDDEHLYIEELILRIAIFSSISPLALIGGFWLALRRLRSQRLGSAWGWLVGFNALFFLVTLIAFDGVAFLQSHLGLDASIGPFLPGETFTIIGSLLDIPRILIAICLLVLLNAGISLGLAWVYAPWQAIRSLGTTTHATSGFRDFGAVYGLASGFALAGYMLAPYVIRILFALGIPRTDPLGVEVASALATLLIPPVAAAIYVSISTWRYLATVSPAYAASSALAARHIEGFSDESTVFTYGPIREGK